MKIFPTSNRFRALLATLVVVVVSVTVYQLMWIDWYAWRTPEPPVLKTSWERDADSLLSAEFSGTRALTDREIEVEAWRIIDLKAEIRADLLPSVSDKQGGHQRAALRIDILRRSSFSDGYLLERESSWYRIPAIRSGRAKFSCQLSTPITVGRYLLLAHISKEPPRQPAMNTSSPDLSNERGAFLFARYLNVIPYVKRSGDERGTTVKMQPP